MGKYYGPCQILCVLALVLAIIMVLFNLLHTPSFSPNSISFDETMPVMTDVSPADFTDDMQEEGLNETPSSTEVVSSGPDSGEQYYNLNTVTFDQLLEVPGIGEVKASAILDMRDDLGGFTSVEQLLDVSGIGESTYDKIAPYFYVD